MTEPSRRHSLSPVRLPPTALHTHSPSSSPMSHSLGSSPESYTMVTRCHGATPLAVCMRTHMRIRNKFITEPLAEFLGTFVICLFAVGASAQHRLMPNESYLMPVFGSAAGLLIAIVAFGGASGSHVNPVVTLCLAITGDLKWTKVPYYWLGQLLGGYLGAGMAFAIYEHRLCLTGGQVCVEAVAIFSPLPATPLMVGMLDQIVTVAVLMVFLFGIIDKRNMNVHKSLFGIYFAVAVAGISASFGLNAGAVLNPARDLGPRLMALTLGHSVDAIFYFGNEPYWLVPLFGPFIGGILGTFIYLLCVGAHLEDEEEQGEILARGSLTSEDWRSMITNPKFERPYHVNSISTRMGYPYYCPTNYFGDYNNNGYNLGGERKEHLDY